MNPKHRTRGGSTEAFSRQGMVESKRWEPRRQSFVALKQAQLWNVPGCQSSAGHGVGVTEGGSDNLNTFHTGKRDEGRGRSRGTGSEPSATEGGPLGPAVTPSQGISPLKGGVCSCSLCFIWLWNPFHPISFPLLWNSSGTERRQ